MPPRRIAVPPTPVSSHNQHRVAGTLLRSQAVHMHEALKWHVAEMQAEIQSALAALAVNPRRLVTEKEIGDYVARVSAILHPRASKPKRK